MLEGEDQIRLGEDGSLTAIGKGGTAAFMLEYTAASLNGESYRLYTQPVPGDRGQAGNFGLAGRAGIGGCGFAGRQLLRLAAVPTRKKPAAEYH